MSKLIPKIFQILRLNFTTNQLAPSTAYVSKKVWKYKKSKWASEQIRLIILLFNENILLLSICILQMHIRITMYS